LTDFELAWQGYRERTDQALLSRLVAIDSPPSKLHEAMRYSTIGAGKRFRAMLVYACGELAGASLEDLDTPAAAVEMVHAYSLVHDDLPAMDDDDLRRGRPTCHKKFDEHTAILVGDALQSRAFELLASSEWNPVGAESRNRMVVALAKAIGSQGMAGGQSIDMQSTGHLIERNELESMHKLKTGALIEGSAILGALTVNNLNVEVVTRLATFARTIGLAFQIADDVLDFTSTSENLGKTAGADDRMKKSTYISILGLEQAREEADRLSKQAIESISGLGDNTAFLKQLANFVVSRKY
jgi:farnesyl diphosphate synthase